MSVENVEHNQNSHDSVNMVEKNTYMKFVAR